MSEKTKISFIYQKDNKVTLVHDNYTTEEVMRPGFYKAVVQSSLFGTNSQLFVDTNVQIPKNSFKIVESYLDVEEIVNYFSEESQKIHADLNVKNKMGIILHGKQGTGKTTICYSLAEFLIEKLKAVIITVTTLDELEFATDYIKNVNFHSEEKLFTIIIFDECEYYMERYESSIKTLLDSSSSVDNCLMLFTTNYFSKIPETISKRPSRIKHAVEVEGIKEEEEVFVNLMNMNESLSDTYKLSTEVIKTMVRNLVNCTLDELKHAFIDKVYSTSMSKIGITAQLEAQSS